MKSLKGILILLMAGWVSSGYLHAQVTLEEVRTASDRVIALHYVSEKYNSSEISVEDVSAWKINDQAAKAVYIATSHALDADYIVYLETEQLEQGKSYSISTPYGDSDFIFDERSVFCEAIKTNQAGYSALSKVRYANFAIWLGTGGSRKIETSLPAYEVVDQQSGEIVSIGSLESLGEDASSADYVYKIDLSAVPEGGPYKVVVNGFGSSYPFGVGGEFSKKLAYISFRAQYMQRCGCPIEIPEVRKDPCHTLVYDVDGPIGEANVVVKGDEPSFKCYGGYHDAGDADRRAYHIINPIVNLMIYEAFPDYFFDGQFDVPGEFDEDYRIKSYTNQVPDILDEAAWGTLAWEYLQNPDGSVHFGTETKGYPDPFEAPMDQDDKKYGTVKTDPRATCTSAGLFMHLARLIAPYDELHAEKLVERAELAMAYGEKDMKDPEKLYFHVQKYLMTGDKASHEVIRELYTLADSMKYHLFLTQGYSLNDIHFDNPAYIYSYIIEKELPVDQEIVDYFTEVIKATADSNMAMLNAHAYPIGTNADGGGWGRNVRQPMYAGAPLLYWSISGDQSYFDAASQLMDYKLGLNPLGRSYVTGLGVHSPHNPHDRESFYARKKGIGLKPGITIFGPGIKSRWGKADILPDQDVRSRERLFDDDLRLIFYTEFTIFETMSHDALYTILAGGGKWNGVDPYK